MKILKYLLVYRRFLLIVLTPLLLLPLPLIIKTKEAECAYTLFVVAIFWLTEALPLAVSALLPAFMFPLFGIMGSKEVASAYFKDFHLLLMGVICLATSIEKWNFHKRVALKMVMLVGVNPAWLTLGFMVSCGFLSMWLSNTSAAAMVMPIVEAVAQQITRAEAEADMLEMSCSNGSTNLALELDGRHAGFKNMFKCGKKKTAREEASAKVIQDEYKKLGPMSYPEIVTFVLFILMTLLWFTRDPGFFPGWSSLFPKYKGYATDSTTALVIGLLFFIIPAKTLTKTLNGETLLCLLFYFLQAEAIHVNPLFILIPATLCTSFAFLLPVANPANAIVFSYGHLTVMDMVKAGLGINIIGVAVVMLAIMTWIVPLFDLYTYPSWAPNISFSNSTGL
uniref:Solute carrier family 13 member 1 n=1 Tax=Pavo cristatus TaxID=9049 RepID=A0A8C9F2G4_PAVCR